MLVSGLIFVVIPRAKVRLSAIHAFRKFLLSKSKAAAAAAAPLISTNICSQDRETSALMNIIVIPYRLTKAVSQSPTSPSLLRSNISTSFHRQLPEFSQCLLKEIGDTFEASHPDDVRHDTDGLAKLRLEVLGNLGSPIGTDSVVKMTA